MRMRKLCEEIIDNRAEVQTGLLFLGLSGLRQAVDSSSLPVPAICFPRPGLPACHFPRPAWPACSGLCNFLHANIKIPFE
jgi:hypothetical protein